MQTVLAVTGLCFDFLGAFLLVRGLLRQQATIVRNTTEDTGDRSKRRLHQKIALSLVERWFDYRDVSQASTEPLIDSLSGLVWAALFLCLGFGLQILSYVIG
jgi:uncharacterized membrane protein